MAEGVSGAVPAALTALRDTLFRFRDEENSMKLCRFDDDRLGVVLGEQVHDVTEAQTQIRSAARYDMKGDPVIAALPAWRKRIEEMAAKAPGKPLRQVKLLSPVARPSKTMEPRAYA